MKTIKLAIATLTLAVMPLYGSLIAIQFSYSPEVSPQIESITSGPVNGPYTIYSQYIFDLLEHHEIIGWNWFPCDAGCVSSIVYRAGYGPGGAIDAPPAATGVPEPGGMALPLLGIGLIAFGSLWRKRKEGRA